MGFFFAFIQFYYSLSKFFEMPLFLCHLQTSRKIQNPRSLILSQLKLSFQSLLRTTHFRCVHQKSLLKFERACRRRSLLRVILLLEQPAFHLMVYASFKHAEEYPLTCRMTHNRTTNPCLPSDRNNCEHLGTPENK